MENGCNTSSPTDTSQPQPFTQKCPKPQSNIQAPGPIKNGQSLNPVITSPHPSTPSENIQPKTDDPAISTQSTNKLTTGPHENGSSDDVAKDLCTPAPTVDPQRVNSDSTPTHQITDHPDSLTFYPFAYALLDDNLFDFCWYCLAPGSADGGSLKRCAGCKTGLFCGKTCQKLGWIDHKPECKGLKNLAPGVPEIEIRMLGRIVYRTKVIENGQDSNPNFYLSRESERSIMEIWTHTDEMRANKREWDKYCEILEVLRKFYPSEALFDDDNKIFELYCRNFINRHAISDQGYMREIGKGLYLDMCAYDHSCRPNSIFVCNGFIATLKPLSPSVNIADKSSTFYTYIDLLATKAERRAMLRDSWYFDCQCARCMDESERVLTSAKCESCGHPVVIKDSIQGPPPKCAQPACGATLSVKVLKSTYTAINDIDKIISNDEIRDGRSDKSALVIAKAYLEKFDNILPRVNISYVRILQQAIMLTDSVEPTNFAQMAEYHAQAIDCMRICYPKNHPALAYHLMNTGIYHYKDDKPEPAKLYLEEAKAMMEFTLGSGHSMTEQAQYFLEKIINLEIENKHKNTPKPDMLPTPLLEASE